MQTVQWLRSVARLPVILVLASFFYTASGWAANPNPQKEETAKPAQRTDKEQQKAWKTKVVEVKYADVKQLVQILQPFGNVVINPELKALTISGYAEAVIAMEETIKRFDVPQQSIQNIELLVYLLISVDPSAPSNVPLELESVLKQLKSNFPAQGYRLMDTVVMRCRFGRGVSVSGWVPPEKGPKSEEEGLYYEFIIRSVGMNASSTVPVFQVDGVKIQLGFASQEAGKRENRRMEFNTDVDIKKDQKVILGKANLDNSGKAVFLVLSARIAD